MTFTIKHKRSDRPMVAEYLCPVHGRFSLEVARDDQGDPPAEVACQQMLTLREAFSHPTKGLRWASPGMPCREPSPHVISAPSVRVRRVEVARGGYEKAEHETWTDTTNLGEGQSLEDWRADRDAVWEREREREVMELTREL